MISVIANALFEDAEERFNVYFESIGGIKAKYHVVRDPIRLSGLLVDGGLFDKGHMDSHKSYPYIVHGEPAQPLMVFIDDKTVNTKYTATQETKLFGTLKVDLRFSRTAYTKVCYLG